MTTIDVSAIAAVTADADAVGEITIDGTVAWVAQKVIDDYEDGDLAEYGTVQPSDAVVNATAAHASDYGLQLDGATGNAGVVRSDSGLANYPGPDDTWEFWWQTQTVVQQMSLYFCVQSSDLSVCYRISLNFNAYTASEMAVEFQERGNSGSQYLDAGNGSSTGTKRMTVSTGTWYRTVIDGQAAADRWRIYTDQGEGTTKHQDQTTDTTNYSHARSGLAYYISGEDNVYIDEVIATEQV